MDIFSVSHEAFARECHDVQLNFEHLHISEIEFAADILLSTARYKSVSKGTRVHVKRQTRQYCICGRTRFSPLRKSGLSLFQTRGLTFGLSEIKRRES